MIPRTGPGAYVALVSAITLTATAGTFLLGVFASLTALATPATWVWVMSVSLGGMLASAGGYIVGVVVEQRRLQNVKAAAEAAAHSRQD